MSILTQGQGFRQECLNGGSNMVWGGPPPGETKIQSFKFLCLKLHFLTEMTPKYGIYIFFFVDKGGYPPPGCGAELGGPDPPGGNPEA